MKSTLQIILSVFVLASLTLACGGTSSASPDVVNTAIAQTQQSQALAQATVNANALTSIPAFNATPQFTPTTSLATDYSAMTEEELAALIDQAVAEAVAATTATTTAVTTTTSDNTVTAEEAAYVYDYYYNADYYVQYAEELTAQYAALYGELANQMIAEMDAINTELAQMNDTLTQVSTSLDEINSTLSQGAAAAQESIDKLNAAAQQAQTKAQALQTQAQDMKSVLQADQQGRVDQLAQLQPNNIPADKLDALHTAFDFLDAAQLAMGDNKISRDELLNLAQLGKNAQAGFGKFGGKDGGIGAGGLGLDLTKFSGKFDEISTQFARGEMPKARKSVGGFQSSLGSRPSGGRPGRR